MLALCSMLLGTYYAQNYASIIGGSLRHTSQNLFWKTQHTHSQPATDFSVDEGCINQTAGLYSECPVNILS